MTPTASAGSTAMQVAGLHFRNPIVLASGTAGYGREVDEVIDLSRIGGLSTKAVSVAPRHGAPPLRVSEFAGGMINAIGLANPGLDEVKREAMPWLAARDAGLRVFVNVVGNSVDDFATVVSGLDASAGVDAFELNVSCPNVKSGGLEFGADPVALAALVAAARACTAPAIVREAFAHAGSGHRRCRADMRGRRRRWPDPGEHDARTGHRHRTTEAAHRLRHRWREWAGVVATRRARDVARVARAAIDSDHRAGRGVDGR